MTIVNHRLESTVLFVVACSSSLYSSGVLIPLNKRQSEGSSCLSTLRHDVTWLRVAARRPIALR